MNRLFRLLGPGFVFILTVLGPGDFVANAVTGATQGYALLWALALAVFFRFIWLDTSARYVLATGETLMDGYARLGAWLLWLVLGSLIVIRLLANLYKLVLLSNTAALLLPFEYSASRYLWSLLFAAAVFFLCDRGGYRALDSWFKALVAVMCCALLAAAILARPSPAAIFRGFFLPAIPGDRGAYGTLFLLMALIGTEAGSLTNLTYSYFVHRKGWRDASFRNRQQIDLLISVGCLLLMSGAVQVAAAGTLLPARVIPTNADDLVPLFSNALGLAGRIIFTFGLCAAAISSYIGGTMGYSMIAADVWSRLRPGAQLEGPEAQLRHRRFLAFWCFTPLCLLFFMDRPLWLSLAVSALMGALIPLLAGVLFHLTSDRQRLGSLAAPPFIRISLAVLVLISTALLATNAAQWVSARLAES
jgi:Mn2+/Fe2+ NRAMP family transporter